MKLMKLMILLLLVSVWGSISEAQTSGGGPTQHSPTMSVTDGSQTCYPYQLAVSSGTLSCANGVSTITTGGSSGGGSTPGGSTTGDVQTLLVSGTVKTFAGSDSFMLVGSNVGIGSTNPSAPLDIVGSARMTGFQLNSGSSLTGKILTSDGLGNGAWVTAPSGSSQWTTTGTDIYYNGGNVGVGTSAPLNMIDVFKNVNSSPTISITNLNNGTASSAQIAAISATAQVFIDAYPSNYTAVPGWGGVAALEGNATNGFVISAGSGPLRLESNGNGTGSERMRILSDGNIGIGTTTDAAGGRLNVVGGSIVGQSNNNTYSFEAGYNNSTGNYEFGATNSANPDGVFSNNAGTERVRFTDGGNVGISSTSPAAKLDVAGSARLTGLAIATGAVPGYIWTSQDGQGLGSWQAPGASSGGAPGGSGSELQARATSTTFAAITGSSSVGSNIGIGTGTPRALLDVNGSVFMTGNVGIGTITPARILEISASSSGTTLTSASASSLGVINSDGTNGNFSDIAFQTIDGAGALSIGVKLAGVFTSHTAASVSGDLAFITKNAGTSSEKMRLLSSGNLGIGTSVPQSKLDVAAADSGTTLTNASAAMAVVTNTDTTANNFEDLSFSAANSSAANVVSAKISAINTSHTAGSESMALSFLTRNAGTAAERLRISSAGNIGIGSTSPNAPLDVAGSVRMSRFQLTTSPTAGFFLTTDGQGNGSWAAGGSGPVTTNTGTANQSSVYTATNVINSSAIMTDNGTNIGIGSTVPRGLLEVKGSGSSLVVGTTGNVGIGTTSTTAQFQIGTASQLTIGTSGIFTTSAAMSSSSASGFLDSATNATIGGNSNSAGNGVIFQGSINGAGKSTFRTTSNATPTTDFMNFLLGNTTNEAMRIVDTNQGQTGFNIGVGSTAPLAQLDVVGTANLTQHFVITSGSNVGIGSTTPGKLLDVGGTMRLTNSGHIISTGTAPTVANNDCGTTGQGTVGAGSTDFRGSFTVGSLTVTSCAVTFAGTFGAAPICFTQDDTNILGVKTTTSTTKMTTTSTTSMSGDVVNYICIE